MQPYNLQCVVRKLQQPADTNGVGTSGGSATPGASTSAARQAPSRSRCPTGATLLSRASSAHPQALVFCSVLWPARILEGLAPPPLVPGLDLGPSETHSKDVMRVTVVGPLVGEGEERGCANSSRMGGAGTPQLLQLGLRSSLEWVCHLAAFPVSAGDTEMVGASQIQPADLPKISNPNQWLLSCTNVL